MTFASSFGRVFSPTFQPKSQAAAVASGTWWDLNGTIASCVAAYQPKGAADYAASLVNLANAGTNDLTGTNAPTWDATSGWQFDGTDDSLGGEPSGKTLIFRFSNIVKPAANVYNALIGQRPSSGSNYAFIIHPCDVNNNITFMFMRDLAAVAGGLDAGVLAVSMSGDAEIGNHIYMNSVVKRSNYNTEGVYFTGNALIGGNSGFPSIFRAGYIQAMAVYSDALTPTQIGNLTTAMAAL